MLLPSVLTTQKNCTNIFSGAISEYAHTILFHNKHTQRKPNCGWWSLWVRWTQPVPTDKTSAVRHPSVIAFPSFQVTPNRASAVPTFCLFFKGQNLESPGKPEDCVWAQIPNPDVCFKRTGRYGSRQQQGRELKDQSLQALCLCFFPRFNAHSASFSYSHTHFHPLYFIVFFLSLWPCFLCFVLFFNSQHFRQLKEACSPLILNPKLSSSIIALTRFLPLLPDHGVWWFSAKWSPCPVE